DNPINHKENIMLKTLAILTALAFPFSASANAPNTTTTGGAGTTWTDQRDSFVTNSQTELADLERKVDSLEKTGTLKSTDNQDKARENIQELKDDIAELRRDISESVSSADQNSWSNEHSEAQEDLQEIKR